MGKWESGANAGGGMGGRLRRNDQWPMSTDERIRGPVRSPAVRGEEFGVAGRGGVALGGGAKLDKAEQIIGEAVRAGIDLEMVDYNISLSPDERVRQDDAALALVREFKQAGERLRANDRASA